MQRQEQEDDDDGPPPLLSDSESDSEKPVVPRRALVAPKQVTLPMNNHSLAGASDLEEEVPRRKNISKAKQAEAKKLAESGFATGFFGDIAKKREEVKEKKNIPANKAKETDAAKKARIAREVQAARDERAAQETIEATTKQREVAKAEEEARQRLFHQKTLALRLQSTFRGFLARQEYRPVIAHRMKLWRSYHAVWNVVTHALREPNLPKPFSWIDVKVKYDMYIEEADVALGSDEKHFQQISESVAQIKYVDEQPFHEQREDNKDNADDAAASFVADTEVVSADDVTLGEVIVSPIDNVEFARSVIRWLESVDVKYREMFYRRVEALASGHRSYAYSKRLTGTKYPIFEAKLDAGQRILWTELRRKNEPSSIIVWFVSKHDKVSFHLRLIDQNFDRQRMFFSRTDIQTTDSLLELGEDVCLLDPRSNAPLKIYTAQRRDLLHLSQQAAKLPLRLSTHEKRVNDQDGTVLLLGRSGTGKTVCLCNRMARDRKSMFGNSLSQLFVCRSRRLKDSVERYQQECANDGDNVTADFVTLDVFVTRMSDEIARAHGKSTHTYQPMQRMTYARFYEEVYPTIRRKSRMDALVLWTQIRTFIKGSGEAVKHLLQINTCSTFHQRGLSLEEYLALAEGRCRLNRDLRIEAYSLYERYVCWMQDNAMWDDCDRILDLLLQSQLAASGNFSGKGKPYDRVYVDEIQDSTQAEILLFFLAAGMNCNALFLAGDPAQAITEGIDFRFEEVRSLVYNFTHGRINRPMTLVTNYRSHAGVLNCSTGILQLLFNMFPYCADVLALDEGLCKGPRPMFFHDIRTTSRMRQLLERNPKIVVLCRDEVLEDDVLTVDSLRQRIPDSTLLLGIRAAKGMEFDDVMIVDFFSQLPETEQRWFKKWKKQLINTEKPDFEREFPELETQLKLLYTAITRCCNRLIFVETKESVASSAFFRWLEKHEYAQQLVIDDTELGVQHYMSNDEWCARGVDLAMTAEGSGAVNLLRNAVRHFERAGPQAKQLKTRALLLEQVEMAKAAYLPNIPSKETELVALVVKCVNVQLYQAAHDLCALVYDNMDEVQHGLKRRWLHADVLARFASLGCSK